MLVLKTSLDQSDFDEDPVLLGRPIVLQSKDGHALWVSTSVVKSSSPFPETIDGGVIVRDASGAPIGKSSYRNSNKHD